MNFIYKKIRLKDSEKIRVWRNNQLDILRQNKIIQPKKQTEYFKKNIFIKNSKQKLISIFYKKILIGYGGLVNISKEFLTAEVSFVVDNKISHNSNLYKEIFVNFLSYIKIYAFDKNNLRRLYTETYSFRKRHIKILEQNGFKFEGRMKQHVFKKKKLYDSIIHGILKK